MIPAKRVNKWGSYPVRMDMSEDLSLCQRAGVFAGVEYWERLTGRNLIDPVVVPRNTPSVVGVPTKGVITVTNEPMYRPGVLDQVEWIQLKSSDVNSPYLHSAEMRIQGCSLRAFTHEVGHALGLGHAQGSSMLMTKKHLPDAWNVTQQEIDAVLEL